MLANLKDALRRHRTVKRETHGHVSFMIGAYPSCLSEIIYQKREATPEQKKALAEILGQPEEWLFTDSSQQKPAATEQVNKSRLKNGRRQKADVVQKSL